MDEKRNQYARLGTATYFIVHREKTGPSGDRKVVVGSAEQFHGYGVDDVLIRAKKNAEPRECPEKRSRTRLHGLYFRPVFCVDEVVECPLLSQISVTARKMLSHRGLSDNLDRLRKQERKNIAELTKRNRELKKELKTPTKAARGNSKGSKRSTEKGRSCSGSKRSPNSSNSPEVRSLTRKNPKLSVGRLCCIIR